MESGVVIQLLFSRQCGDQAPEPVNSLRRELEKLGFETVVIGDAAAPRTVEEAVLEGFKAAYDI